MNIKLNLDWAEWKSETWEFKIECELGRGEVGGSGRQERRKFLTTEIYVHTALKIFVRVGGGAGNLIIDRD